LPLHGTPRHINHFPTNGAARLAAEILPASRAPRQLSLAEPFAEGAMSYTKWNPVQACAWIASRDDAVVAKLAGYNFIQLAIEVEREGDGIIGPRPGWIAAAQSELLDACYAGALTMTGSSLYGGSSTAIPAAAFASKFRFHERNGADCLGPPNLADADCWCDLELQADQVRGVWAKDGTQDDTKCSTAATPILSSDSPQLGRPSEQLDKACAWLRSNYGGVYPRGKTARAILDEMKGDNIVSSSRTLKRAREKLEENKK
jgi:hypothetical protein